jgi:hypothetical protein
MDCLRNSLENIMISVQDFRSVFPVHAAEVALNIIEHRMSFHSDKKM